MKYQRVLLKLSGETLMGSGDFGIDIERVRTLAKSLKHLTDHDLQIGLVIGGGNLFRGIHLEEAGIARTPADQMGMLATLMNGIALQQILAKEGCHAELLSALDCPAVATAYKWKTAVDSLQEGKVLIFAGGTGNPYFTTDTAAALRASEIEADIVLKATKVDGVYDKDPITYTDAKKYDRLTYNQALTENLKIMDSTAFAMCQNNRIPIFVFHMQLLFEGKLLETLKEQNAGTIIQGE